MPKKRITFFMDGTIISKKFNEKYCKSVKNRVNKITYDSTQQSINRNDPDIYTTSIESLEFGWLLEQGYTIYVARNDKRVRFYPGMRNPSNKDIRVTHDIRKMLISGFFDKLFGVKDESHYITKIFTMVPESLHTEDK